MTCRRWRQAGRAVVTGLVALVITGGPALAQPQDGFRPAGPEDFARENLPATPFVFIAYAFVWLALLTYVFLMWRRLGRVERELIDVRARLESGRR